MQLYQSLKQLVDTYVGHTINCLHPGHALNFQFFPFQTVTDRGSFCIQNTASEFLHEECLVEQHVVHNHSTGSYYSFVALLSSVFLCIVLTVSVFLSLVVLFSMLLVASTSGCGGFWPVTSW